MTSRDQRMRRIEERERRRQQEEAREKDEEEANEDVEEDVRRCDGVMPRHRAAYDKYNSDPYKHNRKLNRQRVRFKGTSGMPVNEIPSKSAMHANGTWRTRCVLQKVRLRGTKAVAMARIAKGSAAAATAGT